MAGNNKPDMRRPPTEAEYEMLATFRLRLREFMAFTKAAAAKLGVAPQQYQALLAIKGYAGNEPMSVTMLARQLLIRPHTAVELVARLEKAGLIERGPAPEDRRKTALKLTESAEALLRRLSAVHLAELREHGPALVDILSRLVAGERGVD